MKYEKILKELFPKAIFVLVLAALALILLNVTTQDRDGRRQIVSPESAEELSRNSSAILGNTEYSTDEEEKLAYILSMIKGVGNTEVMVSEKGVIVAAEGAGSAAVRQNIMDAVSALYGIPASSVKVYEVDGEVEK